MSDAKCKSKDTVTIENGKLPSKAVVEIDRFSCYDSTIIRANAPSTGTGFWNLITAGPRVLSASKENSIVLNLESPNNVFEWTVSSAACPVERDTLIIGHELITDTPLIMLNGSLLTSSLAPSYQWYANGSAIVGANGQTYTVLANGTYKVFNSQLNCTNGLFSNEVEIVAAGIVENKLNVLKIFPNPANDFIKLNTEIKEGEIVIQDLTSKVLISAKLKNTNMIDVSSLNSGIYLISIFSEGRMTTSRFIKN